MNFVNPSNYPRFHRPIILPFIPYHRIPITGAVESIEEFSQETTAHGVKFFFQVHIILIFYEASASSISRLIPLSLFTR